MPPLPTISDYALMFGLNPDTARPLGFHQFEYLLGPLDDLAPRVVLMKGAQVGATVLAVLRALWFVDVKQAHTLYLFPTHRSALRFSRGRLAVLIEQSPHLRRLFGKSSGSKTHLRAGHVNWYCHGGRSRVELLSMPVQYLTIDERDAMYESHPLGHTAWSAVELARQRLAGQTEAWELDLSTPTVPGRGIALDFAQSDQRHFEPRCPACGRWVRLAWPDAVAGFDGLPAAASWRCPRCRTLWSTAERAAALAAGVWVLDAPAQSVHGYHLPQLLAAAQTPQRLAAAWQAAQGNPAALQVFWNATLGLPYVAEGARLEARYLEEAVARGGYPMELTSPAKRVLGVDVGPAWLHCVVAEPLSPGLRLTWIGKLPDWHELSAMLDQYALAAIVLDGQPETHQAREFALRHPAGYLCYYVGSDRGVSVDSVARILRTPRTESLDAMFLLWRRGQVWLPAQTPGEFMLHMQSLVRLYRAGRDGTIRAEYVEAGGPDHYAHALTYCHLAGLLARASGTQAAMASGGSVFSW